MTLTDSQLSHTNTGIGLVWSRPLYGDVGHLKHPPCAHWQAEDGGLPLEGDGGGVEDVPDQPRWGVPHSQDVSGTQVSRYFDFCNVLTNTILDGPSTISGGNLKEVFFTSVPTTRFKIIICLRILC